jgi:hypothetical protein
MFRSFIDHLLVACKYKINIKLNVFDVVRLTYSPDDGGSKHL